MAIFVLVLWSLCLEVREEILIILPSSGKAFLFGRKKFFGGSIIIVPKNLTKERINHTKLKYFRNKEYSLETERNV